MCPPGGSVQSLSFPRSTSSYELTGLQPSTEYVITLYTLYDGREEATPVSTTPRGQPQNLNSCWVWFMGHECAGCVGFLAHLNMVSFRHVCHKCFSYYFFMISRCYRGAASGKGVQPAGGGISWQHRQTRLDRCGWGHTVSNHHSEHRRYTNFQYFIIHFDLYSFDCNFKNASGCIFCMSRVRGDWRNPSYLRKPDDPRPQRSDSGSLVRHQCHSAGGRK